METYFEYFRRDLRQFWKAKYGPIVEEYVKKYGLTFFYDEDPTYSGLGAFKNITLHQKEDR